MINLSGVMGVVEGLHPHQSLNPAVVFLTGHDGSPPSRRLKGE